MDIDHEIEKDTAACKHKWTPPPECPQCCSEERDRLQSELVQVKAELEDTAAKMCVLAAELDATRAEVAQAKSENVRMAATLKAIADLSENTRAPYEAQIMKAIEYALGSLKHSTALEDLLAPTIELLKALPHWSFIGASLILERIDSEISRLEAIVKGKQ